MGVISSGVADADVQPSPERVRHQPSVWTARWFWPTFIAVIAGAVLLVGYYGRRVFLWSDDYVFLPDARKVPLDLDLLTTPLFGHFSPVSQLVDSLVAANLPDHPWLIRAILLGLSIAVIGSVAFLMISLFERTWPTLIGTALAAPALSLLGPVNWWTAGLNMMPAFAGAALCLGAMVRLVRGGTRWWGLLAIAAFAVAVLSLELGVTAFGYALVWTVLFRSRVSTERWRDLVRRTAWVWVTLGAIAAWSVLNYRISYYQPTPAPSTSLALDALTTSLFTVQLPLSIGFFDPSRPGFRLLGIGLGIAALTVLVVVTLLRSRRAWRGWSFALLGWVIPVTAVILSRVGYIGVAAVEQPMYYYLPTLLFIVGALEAWAAPWRPQGNAGSATQPARPPRPSTLLAGAITAVALGLAYLSSAWPTISSTNYGMIGQPNAPERDFMANLVDSAQALQASGQPFSVINGVAPGGLLNFQGHNRLSQVTGLHDPSIRFDAPDGPWYRPDATGILVPATVHWSAELVPTPPASELMTSGITAADTGPGFCFTVDATDGSLRWDLPAPVSEGPLVIRTTATVGGSTPVRVSTVTDPGTDPVVTNVNPRTWSVDETGRLDTTAEPQISSVVIDALTVGTSMCLNSIQVGTVGPP